MCISLHTLSAKIVDLGPKAEEKNKKISFSVKYYFLDLQLLFSPIFLTLMCKSGNHSTLSGQSDTCNFLSYWPIQRPLPSFVKLHTNREHWACSFDFTWAKKKRLVKAETKWAATRKWVSLTFHLEELGATKMTRDYESRPNKCLRRVVCHLRSLVLTSAN